MPLTPAEKQRRYRENLKRKGKDEEIKKKDRERKKKLKHNISPQQKKKSS